MAYEVIARKWRPQTFDEVVGQEAITQTLRNAIEQGRIHHAYLFTGARGVGKTTTARILAKALNCIKGVTTEPCGVCPSCVEIASGGSLDVMEIDAASHTGVDNIRDTIINSVGIAPARDRYKVFIIDEVHQLSAAAFNALLKTLEEPPSRVAFILATTELHKVPDTIASRCQVFEFKTIGLAKVQAKLGEIASQLGVRATPAALAAIARAGEGSMRYAQSALDQVIAFAGESIDLPDVSTALGVIGDEVLYDFLDAISKSDAASVLRSTKRLVDGGHDLRHFTRGMMRAVRNLLVTRAVGYDPELVDAAEADAPRVADLAQRFSEAELVRAFALVARLEQDIRLSADPRFQLEVGMVQLAELPRLRPLDDVIRRLEALEARLVGGAPPAGSPPGIPPAGGSPRFGGPSPEGPARGGALLGAPPQASAPAGGASSAPSEPPPFFDDEPPDEPPFEHAAPLPPRPAARPAAPPPLRIGKPESAPAHQTARSGPPLDGPEAVHAIHQAIDAQKKMLLSTALGSAVAMTVDGGRLVVRFPHGEAASLLEMSATRAALEAIARDAVGRSMRVVVVTGEDPVPAAAAPAPVTPSVPAEPSPEPSSTSLAEEDPVVRAFVETFRGQIVGVEKPQ
jgi:DNA polymerase-3 subunit gamma/tau